MGHNLCLHFRADGTPMYHSHLYLKKEPIFFLNRWVSKGNPAKFIIMVIDSSL